MTSRKSAYTLTRESYESVIFDLDGVITQTATLHAAAWKAMFDEYLQQRHLQPLFDSDKDYRNYVDGKPRYAGVKSFLQSRGIELPFGDPSDPPDKQTVCGLGNRKNEIFNERLREGVEVYESTIDLIRKLRRQRFKTAVVSSSKNCRPILEAAGLYELFDALLDGRDAERRGLEGKPSPDIFLAAARDLGVKPDRTVVVEDAIAGVQAGRRGHFGLVIGVDRVGQADSLLENGAGVVVTDLGQIDVASPAPYSAEDRTALPHALDALAQITRRLATQKPVIFLDYDGTLTPIVERPELAALSADMRETVRCLARRFTVAVVSGRDLRDVRGRVGIDELIYAGSHGFDIAIPGEQRIEYQQGTNYLPDLDSAEHMLRQRLKQIPEAQVERKRFSIAVHYRHVSEDQLSAVKKAVNEALNEHPRLRKSGGKKIYELQPAVDWDKGKAIIWLLCTLGLDRSDVLPLYFGDDVTDEDAFRALGDKGIGILVSDVQRRSMAHYYLQDVDEVQAFLLKLATAEGGDKG